MRRLREIAALLVCLLAAGLLTLVLPGPAPEEVAVAPDRHGVAESRFYGARVTAVRASNQVLEEYGDDVMKTDDVFVMVHYDVWSHSSDLGVDAWVEADGGRRWEAVDQVVLPAPGFERSGVAVIEVPRDALPGATFVLVGARTTDPVTLRAALRYPLPPDLAVGTTPLTRPELRKPTVHDG